MKKPFYGLASENAGRRRLRQLPDGPGTDARQGGIAGEVAGLRNLRRMPAVCRE
ncbi:hypothetical protein [Noviherbaspirillum album]|uniref:hypothetical protein n=1 Tax=Noviherbaspirillum album TaxID=3080276 RepID=UPI002DD6BA65|nr:hypothetical protein [Noviherbaspirillum sp. CPCC 100848]